MSVSRQGSATDGHSVPDATFQIITAKKKKIVDSKFISITKVEKNIVQTEVTSELHKLSNIPVISSFSETLHFEF